MVKNTLSCSFKNATIDLGDMTITEIKKDSEDTCDLMEILRLFDGKAGVTLTIQHDEAFAIAKEDE